MSQESESSWQNLLGDYWSSFLSFSKEINNHAATISIAIFVIGGIFAWLHGRTKRRTNVNAQNQLGNIDEAFLRTTQVNMLFSAHFPKNVIDQKIEKEIDNLCKIRFFKGFDKVNSALIFGKRVIEGELSSGTNAVRGRALAWCARLLVGKKLETAKEYLELAKQLDTCPEIDIAAAFVASQIDGKEVALNILAAIDSPSAKSAAFMVVVHREGAKDAINWLKQVKIDSDSLDSEGKFFLLDCQLELAQWEAAEETARTISDHDLANTPILYHIVAITYLLRAVPAEFRFLVLNQLPLYSKNFPLASDASSMNARKAAFHYFSKAADVERHLNCPDIALRHDEYALWLELRNPETTDAGRKRLEDKLRDLRSALQLVPLGLQFEIDVDIAEVEREIERNIALHGGITHESAIARLALVLEQEPKDVASYVERHYDDLSKFLGKKQIDILRIEALSRAGMPNEAERHLLPLSKNGLSEEDEARLRRMISEASGKNPVDLRKDQFRQTGALNDLMALVDELYVQQSWSEVCEFGYELFRRTHSVDDAERLARALISIQKSKEIIDFLKPFPDILQQSKNLQMVYCWALYHEGHLLEARSELAKLDDMQDDPNYRQLGINLGIALGDWNSLLAYIENEYRARDNRDASELIQTAYLAHHLDSPQVKNLTLVAADKGKDDPEILVAAYNLAATAGWENDEVVVQWIQRAADLSRDGVPIRRVTLKDLAEWKPEWDRRESKTWQMLGKGDMPMFLAGEALNKTLVNLMLFTAFANLSKRDPRRRGAISAYSGKHHPLPLDASAKTVGIDASALLTLGFLNLLDEVLDAFETVYVPHSTLIWLFEEKQRTAFHQPSRVRDASRVQDMLATDTLVKFVPSTVADSDLSAQVGYNLATLIAEAEKLGNEDDVQHIVVSPSPVHRLGSLIDEEADLTEHTDVMSSCLAIVEKLKQQGQITAEEENKAQIYLQVHEKPWPKQPDISDGAVLYLDDLAINYFLHLGILDKLKAAGFKAIASPSEVSESNALISYESSASRVIETIERIRVALHSRIESGKIRVSRQRKPDNLKERPIVNHPTVGVFTLAEVCDAIIVDDRFVNQHESISENSAQATIFSTLDVLDGLVLVGAVNPDRRTECRTLLRRAGYFFVPVREDELTQYLNACPVTKEEIDETAELRAIRENLLRVRMSDWLQLPKEALWLDMNTRVFITVLKGFWKPGADISRVKAISDWIVSQIDTRGWAHCLDVEIADNIAKTGRGNCIFLLITPPLNVPKHIREVYWEWMEARVLSHIEEQFPEIYEWIVDIHKQNVLGMADMDLEQGGTT